MRSSIRRAAVFVLASLALAGCTAWHAQPAPQPSAGTFVAQRARITRGDGATVYLVNAYVRGDSLYGGRGERGGAPFAIAVADVRGLEVRTPKHVATTALVLLGSTAVTLLGLAIAFDVSNT